MISVKNITKSYDHKKAVDDVSFEIGKGEVVGLLGPNGAGKTTILNIITGVLFPDQGEVYVNGQLMSQKESTIKKEIGYLAEDNPLYTHLLVSESVELAARLKGLSPEEYQSNLSSVVRSTGLSEVFYQPIASLSKGLKQRVGLAQALISHPSILIMDEPSEGLDPLQRQEIRKLIRELGEEHTVLLSTHVMQEVEAVCQRVIILNKGKIVVSGKVDEITREQEGLVEIECILVGNTATEMVSLLHQKFDVSVKDDGSLVVRLESQRETDFYQLIGEKTSREVFVTRLVKKRAGLEEVFRRLTKE